MSGKCTCEHGAGSHDGDGCFHRNGHDEYCDCSWVPDPLLANLRQKYLDTHKCSVHKSYKAIKMPTAQCEACWSIWLGMKRYR